MVEKWKTYYILILCIFEIFHTYFERKERRDKSLSLLSINSKAQLPLTTEPQFLPL